VSDVDLYVAAMVLTNPSGIMVKPQHHSDRTGVDIAVVDVPAFRAGVRDLQFCSIAGLIPRTHTPDDKVHGRRPDA